MSGLPDDGEDLFGFLYRKVFSPGEERNHLGQRPVEVGVQYRRNNCLGVLFFGNERVVFVTFAPFRTSDVAFVLEYFDESGDYNRGIQMYRFPNSDVQKSVIFEGIKKRLKIV